MIYGITLILLGLLAAPSLLLAKKPGAKEQFDKIAPYQGWIGAVFALWGVWGIISALINFGMLGAWPVYWITWLAGSLVQAALGFILGYGLITKHALSKNPQAALKGEEWLRKLTPVQGKLGLVAIVLGVWQIILTFIYVGNELSNGMGH